LICLFVNLGGTRINNSVMNATVMNGYFMRLLLNGKEMLLGKI